MKIYLLHYSSLQECSILWYRFWFVFRSFRIRMLFRAETTPSDVFRSFSQFLRKIFDIMPKIRPQFQLFFNPQSAWSSHSTAYSSILIYCCLISVMHIGVHTECARLPRHTECLKHRAYRIFLFLWVCIFKWCLVLIVKGFSFFSPFGEWK